MVFINHPTWTQADLPFGGTKRSGFGRELSELGIKEFVNKKLVRISGLNDPLTVKTILIPLVTIIRCRHHLHFIIVMGILNLI